MERDGRAVFNRFLVGGSRQAGPAGPAAPSWRRAAPPTAPLQLHPRAYTAPPYSSTRARDIILSEIMYPLSGHAAHTRHRAVTAPHARPGDGAPRGARTPRHAPRGRRPPAPPAPGAFPYYLRSTGSACALIMGRRASASTAGSGRSRPTRVLSTVKYCHCGPPSNRAQARS